MAHPSSITSLLVPYCTDICMHPMRREKVVQGWWWRDTTSPVLSSVWGRTSGWDRDTQVRQETERECRLHHFVVVDLVNIPNYIPAALEAFILFWLSPWFVHESQPTYATMWKCTWRCCAECQRIIIGKTIPSSNLTDGTHPTQTTC